jgi:thermitase
MAASRRLSTFVLALATGLLVVLGSASGALAATAKKAPAYERSTILVKFASPVQAPAIVARLGDRILGKTATGVDVIRIGTGSVNLNVAQYKKLAAVDYAEPNFIARGQLSPPNDPSYGSQWGYAAIDAVDGWTAYPGRYGGGGGVTIGILDTGVQASHPDLNDGRVLTALGASCLTGDGSCVSAPASDDNGHGTHVSGIADAETNNSTGVAGTGFTASIIPVKVLDSNAQGNYAGLTNGIMWAVDHGARVINMSIGASAYSQTLCDAVSQAISRGTLVVASAGNNSSSAANYPAACKGAVGVSATTSSDKLASFSNYGSPDVFVAAPGDSIYSTYLNSSYATMSGTSMAAPYVTGLAALLFAQVPSRTVADVKQILATTSEKVGGGYGSDPYGTCSCTWSSSFGYGRIDVYRALTAAPAAADFALTAAPDSATSAPLGTVGYSIGVSAYNGFSGSVDFSVSGLPSDATAIFAPPSVSASGSTQLRIVLGMGTPTGTYTLTVTGRSGGLVHTTTLTLVVASAGDFNLTVTPPFNSVRPPLAAYFLVRVDPVGLFGGPVTLSVTGLPAGVTALFTPPVVAAPGASTLVVQAPLGTVAGTYTLTITGTSGQIVHTATAILAVK